MKAAALVWAIVSTLAVGTPPPGYHPVVFVGPLLGQTLEINNRRENSCSTKGNWSGLWLGEDMFEILKHPTQIPGYILCLPEALSVFFDAKNNITTPNDNVEVRPAAPIDMMGGVVWSHLKDAGYVEGESAAGHTYDWRLSVHDWEVQSFEQLRRKVEGLVHKAGGSKVVLTGISMAGPFTHRFLSWTRTMDPEWNRNFIHAFVPMGGPFNGAVQALLGTIGSLTGTFATEGSCPKCVPPKEEGPVAQNDTFINNLIRYALNSYVDTTLKDIAWSWPVMYWMSTGLDYSYSSGSPRDDPVLFSPNGKAPAACLANSQTATKCGGTGTREGWKFDDPNFVNATECAECYKSVSKTCSAGYQRAYRGWIQNLCCKVHTCSGKSYSPSELPDFLHKVDRPGAASMMNYALTVDTTGDPGVPVHCIYGHNIQTHAFIRIEDEVDPSNFHVVFDDGDQTVDAKSLSVCERWSSTIKTYKFPGMKHSGALMEPLVAKLVVGIVLENDAVWQDWTDPAYEQLNETVRVPKNQLYINKGKTLVSTIYESFMAKMVSPVVSAPRNIVV